jgi:hypothetical protein
MGLGAYDALSPARRLDVLLQHSPDLHRPHATQATSAATSPLRAGSAAAAEGYGLGGAAERFEGGALPEAAAQRFEHFARATLLPHLSLEPRGGRLLCERMVALAQSAQDEGALGRVAALVHASRHVLPPSERLLRPVRVLIETVLRCVYSCPRADDEALDLMTTMYNDLPPRAEALAEAEEEGEDEAAAEQELEIEAETEGEGVAGSGERSPPRSLLGLLDEAMPSGSHHPLDPARHPPHRRTTHRRTTHPSTAPTLSPSHPPTLPPSQPLTVPPCHPLTLPPSHPHPSSFRSTSSRSTSARSSI